MALSVKVGVPSDAPKRPVTKPEARCGWPLYVKVPPIAVTSATAFDTSIVVFTVPPT
jgi:hypothetical protein